MQATPLTKLANLIEPCRPFACLHPRTCPTQLSEQFIAEIKYIYIHEQ